MPPESSFLNHIELARAALGKFQAIAAIGYQASTLPALEELIAVTGDFIKFNPYYINDSRFFEVPNQVYEILEEFYAKNPTYKKSLAYQKVIGLNNRSKIIASAAKKGRTFCRQYFFILLTSTSSIF
jgi:hypothetical protein